MARSGKAPSVAAARRLLKRVFGLEVFRPGQQQILEYFGENPEWDQCGICDNCRHPLEDQIAEPSCAVSS